MALPILSKVVAPIVVAGILSGTGYVISLSSRVSAVEAHQQEQAAHVTHIEKRLDSVDDHLNDLVKATGRIEGALSK